MSAKLVGLALAQGGLSTTEKLILIGLADCTNTHTGACFPSVKWLADVAECSERTVHRALRSLEEKQLIETVSRPGSTNHYSVLQPVDNSPTGYDTVSYPGSRGMTQLRQGRGDTAMSGGCDTAMSHVTRKNQKLTAGLDDELEPDGSSSSPHHYCRTERSFVDVPKAECPTKCQPADQEEAAS